MTTSAFWPAFSLTRTRNRVGWAGGVAVIASLVVAGTVFAQGQTVTWTGSGASGGLCNNVSGTGQQQTWQIKLTSPHSASGSTLTAAFDEGETQVNASLTTNLLGDDNDLVYTAATAGAAGNQISVEYVVPTVPDSPLSVTLIGDEITVSAATNSAADVVSTASNVMDAVNAHPGAPVVVGLASGDNGSGLVTAMARTNLSGGGAGRLITTHVAAGAKIGGGNSPYVYSVTTTAGAQLLNASATNGTSRSNLTVGACTLSG